MMSLKTDVEKRLAEFDVEKWNLIFKLYFK